MSSIIRQSTSRFAGRFRASAALSSNASRSFTSSSVRALKESDRDTEDKGTDYEKHKQDQLNKQKSGKGHWKPELASNSEEAVHAERESKLKNESIDELQKRTASHANEKSKHGTSQDSGH